MSGFSHSVRSFEASLRQRSTDYRTRMSAWRSQHAVQRAESPTNPFRARTLGYKATKAFTIVRVRVKRGKRARKKADLGRKPGKNRKHVNPGISIQKIAEGKAKRRHSNLDLINSYLVGEDGEHKFYEVILRDPRL